MRFHVTVLGAGSLAGRAVCRRAAGLNWKVTAYSTVDYFYYKPGVKSRVFYVDDSRWMDNVTWYTSFNYDEAFVDLHEDVANSAGLVYIPERTPALRDGLMTFEENAVRVAMQAGKWSVRHLVIVSDEAMGCGVSKEAQEEIAKCHPRMMVSLLRPGRVWSRNMPSTCLPLYKRAFQAKFMKVGRLDMSEDTDVGHCVTTLIHNESDAGCYRLLDSGGILTYMHTHKNPDDPEDTEDGEDTTSFSGNDDDASSSDGGYDNDGNGNDDEDDDNEFRKTHSDEEHDTFRKQWSDDSSEDWSPPRSPPKTPGIFTESRPSGKLDESPEGVEEREERRRERSGLPPKGSKKRPPGFELRMDSELPSDSALNGYESLLYDSCATHLHSAQIDTMQYYQLLRESAAAHYSKEQMQRRMQLPPFVLGKPRFFVSSCIKGKWFEHELW